MKKTLSTSLTSGIDYLRRRVEKKVINSWNGSSGTNIAHLKYVYDGHNLFAEINGSNHTVLTT